MNVSKESRSLKLPNAKFVPRTFKYQLIFYGRTIYCMTHATINLLDTHATEKPVAKVM